MTYEEIESEGKKYPVRYGFWALNQFCKVCGLTLADLGKLESQMQPEHAIGLVWAGLKDGHRKAKLSFDLSLDDIADLIDEDAQLITKCMTVFGKHQQNDSKTEKKNNRKQTKGRK